MSAVAGPLREPGTAPTRHSTRPSPVGELILVGDGTALTGLYLGVEHRWAPALDPAERGEHAMFDEVAGQLAEYFAGERRVFELPLAPRGTPFQRRVWRELAEVDYGTTTTYGALARRMGAPGSSRAVGLANGRNPISIILPCHRVIGADGSLVGYGGGLPAKQRLLAGERSPDDTPATLF